MVYPGLTSSFIQKAPDMLLTPLRPEGSYWRRPRDVNTIVAHKGQIVAGVRGKCPRHAGSGLQEYESPEKDFDVNEN